jgi:DtxR family manganese transport transcriptional regulator
MAWRTKLADANNQPQAFTCQSISCDIHEMTEFAADTRAATGDRSSAPRAEAFQGVREARSRELAEDYVELIAELIHDQGEARPVDIASRLGVKVPTVSKTLDRLAREGLITRAKYRSVFLTDSGRALAKECGRRHDIVLRFLIRLGLDPDTAERDAEGIEHHVSERTLMLFAAFALG